MPEPLSIATGVISLVFNCIKGLEIAKIYVDKYSKADLKLISLSTSCEALHEALRQISDLISSQNGQKVLQIEDTGGLESLERFEKVFGNCSIVFAILHERVKPLLEPTFQANNTVAKRSRVAAVWNDSNIDAFIALVRDLTPAVQLLFAAFTAKSTFETHRILTSQNAARLFNRVDSDTQSLYTVHRERSIVQRTTDGEESILGDEEFPVLDDLLVNSKVYRRVLEASLKRAADENPGNLPRQSADQPLNSSDKNATDAASLNSVATGAEDSSAATQQKRHPRRAAQRSFLGNMFRPRRPQRPLDTTRPESVVSDEGTTISRPSTSLNAIAQHSYRTDPWENVKSLVEGAQSVSAADFSDEDETIDALLDAQASKIEHLLGKTRR